MLAVLRLHPYVGVYESVEGAEAACSGAREQSAAVVAVADMGAKVERAMQRASKLEQKQLDADADEIERDASATASQPGQS